MAGANNIKDTVLKEKLTFLHSILQLPDQAAPRQVLLELITPQITVQCHLDALNLLDISTLTSNFGTLIACQVQLNLLEETESKKDLDPPDSVLHQAQCCSPTLEGHTLS